MCVCSSVRRRSNLAKDVGKGKPVVTAVVCLRLFLPCGCLCTAKEPRGETVRACKKESKKKSPNFFLLYDVVCVFRRSVCFRLLLSLSLSLSCLHVGRQGSRTFVSLLSLSLSLLPNESGGLDMHVGLHLRRGKAKGQRLSHSLSLSLSLFTFHFSFYVLCRKYHFGRRHDTHTKTSSNSRPIAYHVPFQLVVLIPNIQRDLNTIKFLYTGAFRFITLHFSGSEEAGKK